VVRSGQRQRAISTSPHQDTAHDTTYTQAAPGESLYESVQLILSHVDLTLTISGIITVKLRIEAGSRLNTWSRIQAGGGGSC